MPAYSTNVEQRVKQGVEFWSKFHVKGLMVLHHTCSYFVNKWFEKVHLANDSYFTLIHGLVKR